MEVAFPAPRQANKHAVNCRLTSHVLAACRPPTTDHTPPTAKCRLLPPLPLYFIPIAGHSHICIRAANVPGQTHTHTHAFHVEGPLKVFGKELSLNNATQPTKVQKLGTHRTLGLQLRLPFSSKSSCPPYPLATH